MIIANRKTGEVIQKEEISLDQQKAAALSVFRAFCQISPDAIREAVEGYLNEDN